MTYDNSDFQAYEQIAVVCAWCPMNGRKETILKDGDFSKPLSHGICKACMAAEIAKKGDSNTMQTLNEMRQHVGKQGLVRANNVLFSVEVLDVRSVYGRLQYLIKPIQGEGISWINEESLIKDGLKINNGKF